MRGSSESLPCAGVDVVDLTGGPSTSNQAVELSQETRHPDTQHNKRKFSHLDEEQRVIGKLKRVQLMESDVRGGSDDIVVLDEAFGGLHGAWDVGDTALTEDGRGLDETTGGQLRPEQLESQWYTDELGPSVYRDVNKMLGEVHREMLGRRVGFLANERRPSG